MSQHKVPVVLLAGWLFADLLLGLTVIFLAALPGKPQEAPILEVNTNLVTKKPSDCATGRNVPICSISVVVSESSASLGTLTWQVKSDVSQDVVFSPMSTTLKPGQTQPVSISALPCQNGSILFTGSGSNGLQVQAVTVGWQCTSLKRLAFVAHSIPLTVDYQGLLNGDQNAINGVKTALNQSTILQGQHVGFAIVYDGAPTDGDIQQADKVDAAIYRILPTIGGPFQDASYYTSSPLYNLGPQPTQVVIDVFFYVEEE